MYIVVSQCFALASSFEILRNGRSSHENRSSWFRPPKKLQRGSFLLLYRHIGLLFGNRLDTNLQRQGIRKYPRQNFIGFVEDFFPLWRADLKMSGFAVESVGRVRTEAVSGKRKVADSKISGYVWTRS